MLLHGNEYRAIHDCLGKYICVVDECSGTTFSYDKLFGTKPLTSNDLRNQQEGKDTGIDRTKRLFYVTYSCTEESLAIIVYTDTPSEIARTALLQGWFEVSDLVETNTLI